MLAPIVKVESDGLNRFVWGKVTDGSVDSDDQIVDPTWAKKAMAEWYDTGANVRQQHSTMLAPAGKGVLLEHKEGDGEYVKTKVVDANAIRLVDEGVYTGYSVGIARPRIERDMKARGGRIVAGKIVEISLVDRPALPTAKFAVLKAASGTGTLEYIGKVVILDGAEDFIATTSGILPTPSRALKRIRTGAHVTVHVRNEGVLEAIEGRVVTKSKGGISLDLSGYGSSGVVLFDNEDIEGVYKGRVPLDVLTKAAHVGIPDQADFRRGIANDSTRDIRSALRRLSQWVISGEVPAGLDHEDIESMYLDYTAEMRKRNSGYEIEPLGTITGMGRIGKCESLTKVLDTVVKYSEDQPRDDHGRFGAGDSQSVKGHDPAPRMKDGRLTCSTCGEPVLGARTGSGLGNTWTGGVHESDYRAGNYSSSSKTADSDLAKDEGYTKHDLPNDKPTDTNIAVPTEDNDSVTTDEITKQDAPVCPKCKGTGLFGGTKCTKCGGKVVKQAAEAHAAAAQAHASAAEAADDPEEAAEHADDADDQADAADDADEEPDKESKKAKKAAKAGRKAFAPTVTPTPAATNAPDTATDSAGSADVPAHDADAGAATPPPPPPPTSTPAAADDAPAAAPAKPKFPFKGGKCKIAEKDGKFLVKVKGDVIGTHSTREAAEAQKNAVVTERKAARDSEIDGNMYLVRRAHDYTCSAYKLEDVGEAYPTTDKNASALGPDTNAALVALLAAEKDPHNISCLGKAIGALGEFLTAASASGPEFETTLEAARGEMNAAFKAINAEVSTGDYPKPSEDITPGAYKRPYISAGHASESGSAKAPRIPTTTHPVRATDFTRGPLTDGHQRYLSQKLAEFHDALSEWNPSICRMDSNGYQAFDRQPAETFVRDINDKQIPNQDHAAPTPVGASALAAASKSESEPSIRMYTESEVQAVLSTAMQPYIAKVQTLEDEYNKLAASPDPNRSALRGATGLGVTTKIAQARTKKVQQKAARKDKRDAKIDNYRLLAASPDSEMRIHAQRRLAKLGVDA